MILSRSMRLSIMVIAARGKTLLTKAKDGKLWPMDPLNRLASFEALLSEVDAKIQEHGEGISSQLQMLEP